MKKRFLKITSDNNFAFVIYDSGEPQVYNLDNISSIFLKFNKKSWFNNNPVFMFLIVVDIYILIEYHFFISSLLLAFTILFIIGTINNYKSHSLIINLKDQKIKTIKIHDKFKLDTINTINKIKSKLKKNQNSSS